MYTKVNMGVANALLTLFVTFSSAGYVEDSNSFKCHQVGYTCNNSFFTGSILGIDKYDNCLKSCGNLDDDLCQWFTFTPSTKECKYFSGCQKEDMVVDCEGCITGQRQCQRRTSFDDPGNPCPVDNPPEPELLTIRLQKVTKHLYYDAKGQILSLSGSDLYGSGLNTTKVRVKLTTAKAEYGELCKTDATLHTETESFALSSLSNDGLTASLTIPGESLPYENEPFYFCLSDDGKEYLHQGMSTGAEVKVYKPLLPLWTTIIFIAILLMLSGLFSGLNLGLMALDLTELKIVQSTGTDSEKKYAKKIMPIRRHGNYLLCTLLLGNVLVNSTLTTLLNTLTTGLIAVIGSTFSIVLLGEIIPQAICSRHGLAVGAHTIYLTYFFMFIVFPIAFPISKILDLVLGKEMNTVYDKKKLIELINDANNDLEKEEMDIVTGALVYKDKKVQDIMTKLEDVYMLPLEAVLDFETVTEIRSQGYSRIPIYENNRKNIVHVLFAKDLMFIDPDDKMPLSMVCNFYTNNVNFVFHDTTLNIMFNEFKSGEKGHMAFVQIVKPHDDGEDPSYETIGLVTLEDIIEEIIQQEIMDETDVVTDNITKKRRNTWQEGHQNHFGRHFHEVRNHVTISPQLALAVCQYLSTSIEPFRPPNMSDYVLKSLLTLDVFRQIKMKKDKSKMLEEEVTIIKKGKPIDFFILVIEGKVEITIGPEELVFESGPFTYFGVPALNNVLEGEQLSAVAAPTTAPPIADVANHQMTFPPRLGISPLDSTSAATTPVRMRKYSAQVPNMSRLTVPGEAPAVRIRKTSSQSALWLKPSSFLKRQTASHADSLNNNNNNIINLVNEDIVPLFVPDYTVKAVTDVLFLRIRRATYIAAVKASQMSRNLNVFSLGGDGMMEMSNLLETIAEDNADTEPTVLVRTPSLRSLVKDDNNSSNNSGGSTPKIKIDSVATTKVTITTPPPTIDFRIESSPNSPMPGLANGGGPRKLSSTKEVDDDESNDAKS